MYRLFTDGACKANGLPHSRGGWAYLLMRDELPGFSMEETGRESPTTNNRMELKAVIEGLRSVPTDNKVEVVTDSKYVITVSASRNTKLVNMDLIECLRRELNRLDVSFILVKGHSGHKENERVDKLASSAAIGRVPFATLRK